MAHRSIHLGALVLLPCAALAAPAQPVKSAAWQLEKTPALVRLARASAPVSYLGGRGYNSPLVLECLLPSRSLAVRLESQVKAGGAFTIRFDSEAASTVGGGQPEWSNERQAYLLRVPAADVAQFVNAARTSKGLMIRHQFSGVPYDVHFDLAGFEKEFSPLAEACGVGPVVQRSAAAETAKAPRPVPKADREVGPWSVRESVSTVDDKLIVVVFGTDKAQTMDMYLRCREGAIEGFFVQRRGVFDADGQKLVTIEVAVDGGEPVRHEGPTTDLNKAAFVDDGRAFIAWLAGHKSLGTTYTPYRAAANKTVTFSLATLDAALEPLREACPASEAR